MDVETTPAADGAETGQHQNIARAAAVLTALAEAGAAGLRLADVTRITRLSKTVAHRCLAGLLAHGLAEYDERSSRFYLGDRIFKWTASARDRFDLTGRLAPFLQRLADETQDTVYFMLRRGDDAVCYGRAEGDFPIKTLTLNLADRRPLGIGACSLAIFAWLDDREIERLMVAQREARAPYGIADDMLRDMVAAARCDGFSTNENRIIAGMTGIGVPISDATGRVIAGLSIAAISPRLDPARRRMLAGRLRQEAALIEAELAAFLAG